RQYITQGNLSENPKAYIFVMDYARRRRVKLWGEARMVEDDPALLQALMPKGYRARPEQVVVFKIAAWDTNCPQHIPQKFDAADVAAALATRDARIAELEAELAALKGQPPPAHWARVRFPWRPSRAEVEISALARQVGASRPPAGRQPVRPGPT